LFVSGRPAIEVIMTGMRIKRAKKGPSNKVADFSRISLLGCHTIPFGR
jgi:hypothetical protein